MPLPTNRDVTVVVSAGAVGGFLVSAAAFVEPATFSAFGPASWFKLVLLPICLGCIAAGIGVFVLVDTDTTNKVRMFFFAAICGLSSQAVIDSGKNLVTGDARKTGANLAVKEQAQRIVELSQNSQAKPEALAEKTADLYSSAKTANVEAVKADVSQAVDAALKTAAASSSTATSINAISSIGIAAARANDLQNAARALRTIDIAESSGGHSPGELLTAREAIRKELPQGLRLADR